MNAQEFLDNIKINVNAPECRGMTTPLERDDMINESNFADGFRYKHIHHARVGCKTLRIDWLAYDWPNPKYVDEETSDFFEELGRYLSVMAKKSHLNEDIKIKVNLDSNSYFCDGPKTGTIYIRAYTYKVSFKINT